MVKTGVDKINQYQANLLFEGPEVDLADRYANMIKSCLVTVFYAPLVPIGIIISAVGLLLEAAVFKYMLIKVHTMPKKQGQTLALESAKWLKVIPSLYALGIFIFFYPYVPDIQVAIIIFSVLVWLYNLSFVEFLIDKRFEDRTLELLKTMHKENDKENDYYQQFPEFYTVFCIQDYERENPVTRAEGWEKWFKIIEKKEGNKDYKKFKRVNFELGIR